MARKSLHLFIALVACTIMSSMVIASDYRLEVSEGAIDSANTSFHGSPLFAKTWIQAYTPYPEYFFTKETAHNLTLMFAFTDSQEHSNAGKIYSISELLNIQRYDVDEFLGGKLHIALNTTSLSKRKSIKYDFYWILNSDLINYSAFGFTLDLPDYPKSLIGTYFTVDTTLYLENTRGLIIPIITKQIRLKYIELDMTVSLDGYHLSLSPYSQRYYTWADTQLGNQCDVTIGQKGCALASRACTLTFLSGMWYLEPYELDKYSKCLGDYEYITSCNMAKWDTSIECDIYWPFITYDNSYKKIFDKNIIDQYLKDNLPVIAQTTAPGVGMHFVVIVGKTKDGDYIIMDPWDGGFHLFSSGALGKYTGIGLRLYSTHFPWINLNNTDSSSKF
jgi:hypothetical protein